MQITRHFKYVAFGGESQSAVVWEYDVDSADIDEVSPGTPLGEQQSYFLPLPYTACVS